MSRRTIVSVALSVFSILCVACMASAQTSSTLQLIPQPKEARLVAGIPLRGGIAVDVPGGDAEDKFAAQDLQETLHSYGIPVVEPHGTHLPQLHRIHGYFHSDNTIGQPLSDFMSATSKMNCGITLSSCFSHLHTAAT